MLFRSNKICKKIVETVSNLSKDLLKEINKQVIEEIQKTITDEKLNEISTKYKKILDGKYIGTDMILIDDEINKQKTKMNDFKQFENTIKTKKDIVDILGYKPEELNKYAQIFKDKFENLKKQHIINISRDMILKAETDYELDALNNIKVYFDQSDDSNSKKIEELEKLVELKRKLREEIKEIEEITVMNDLNNKGKDILSEFSQENELMSQLMKAKNKQSYKIELLMSDETFDLKNEERKITEKHSKDINLKKELIEIAKTVNSKVKELNGIKTKLQNAKTPEIDAIDWGNSETEKYKDYETLQKVIYDIIKKKRLKEMQKEIKSCLR